MRPDTTDRPEQGAARRGAARPLGLVASLLAIAACVSVWPPPEPLPYHRTAEIADAEAIGAEECEVCHEDVKGHAPATTYHADCEACHGPGSVHADSEEPLDIRYPGSRDCLACHESGRASHLAWATGEHERAGVLCSDCHATHEPEPHLLRAGKPVAFGHLDTSSKLCVQCHSDVASRLNLPSHHPVREGMLSCTDCHRPHDDRRVALGDPTQLCSGCHQDHVGPWVFEHPPVVEDCTSCHNPHGAASYNLLDVTQPALCLSCHTVPSFHAPGATFYTRCTDCHGAIHGSHRSPSFREN